MEQDLVTVKGAAHKQTYKISKSDKSAKSKVSVSDVSMSESESSSDESLVPNLNVLKSKKSVQVKVDERLKQLKMTVLLNQVVKINLNLKEVAT